VAAGSVSRRLKSKSGEETDDMERLSFHLVEYILRLVSQPNVQ
jgi:hypothetical protein